MKICHNCKKPITDLKFLKTNWCSRECWQTTAPNFKIPYWEKKISYRRSKKYPHKNEEEKY